MKRSEQTQKERPPPLKIAKPDRGLHNLRKRQLPVIVHTLSPEVITVEACNFMRIVQRLTGRPAAASSAAAPGTPISCKKPRGSILFAEEATYVGAEEEAPALISIESRDSSLEAANHDAGDHAELYGQEDLADEAAAGAADSAFYPDYLYPHCYTSNPNRNSDPAPSSSSSTIDLFRPFVKPSAFLSHCGSLIKRQSPDAAADSLQSPVALAAAADHEPSSPFLWSPSFFDLSPSRLPSPSTFFPQLVSFTVPAADDISSSRVSFVQ